jgi:hypothetical protein
MVKLQLVSLPYQCSLTRVPSNLEFQVDDAEQAWTFNDDEFDFIHIGHMTQIATMTSRARVALSSAMARLLPIKPLIKGPSVVQVSALIEVDICKLIVSI